MNGDERKVSQPHITFDNYYLMDTDDFGYRDIRTATTHDNDLAFSSFIETDIHFFTSNTTTTITSHVSPPYCRIFIDMNEDYIVWSQDYIYYMNRLTNTTNQINITGETFPRLDGHIISYYSGHRTISFYNLSSHSAISKFRASFINEASDIRLYNCFFHYPMFFIKISDSRIMVINVTDPPSSWEIKFDFRFTDFNVKENSIFLAVGCDGKDLNRIVKYNIQSKEIDTLVSFPSIITDISVDSNEIGFISNSDTVYVYNLTTNTTTQIFESSKFIWNLEISKGWVIFYEGEIRKFNWVPPYELCFICSIVALLLSIGICTVIRKVRKNKIKKPIEKYFKMP